LEIACARVQQGFSARSGSRRPQEAEAGAPADEGAALPPATRTCQQASYAAQILLSIFNVMEQAKLSSKNFPMLSPPCDPSGLRCCDCDHRPGSAQGRERRSGGKVDFLAFSPPALVESAHRPNKALIGLCCKFIQRKDAESGRGVRPQEKQPEQQLHSRYHGAARGGRPAGTAGAGARRGRARCTRSETADCLNPFLWP